MSQFYTSNRSFRSDPGDHAGAVRLRAFCCSIFWSFPIRSSASSCCSSWCWAWDSRASACGGSRCFCTANGLTELTAFQGALTIDGFALFFNWIFVAGHADRRHRLLQLPGDRRRAPRRILRADAVRAVRHVLPGRRHGPGHAVHRPGADGALLLRDGGLPAQRQALERSRHEVSAAGRVFERLSGVRILHDVRLCGLDQAARHRRRHRRARSVGPDGVPGHGDHRGRAAVQDFRGAVPHVGAGRLRRRADHGHRLSFGGFESRVVRVPAAHFPGTAGLGARRPGSRCWPWSRSSP